MASIQKRGPAQWRVIVRRKGLPAQSATFDSKREAEAWARKVESDIDRGAFEDQSEAEELSLREALEHYRRSEFPRLKRGGAGEHERLNRLQERLGDYSLASLRARHIARYRDERLAEGAANQTVAHELGLMSRLLKTASREWDIYLPRGIVTEQVRRPSLPNGRERRLSPEEEEALLAEARRYGGDIHDVIVLALETGMRRGELARLRWENINLPAKTAYIPDTKTGEPRSVPLSKRARATLEARGPLTAGAVWAVAQERSLTQAFTRIRQRAGLTDLRLHDLRHEATSRLFEKGLDLIKVSAITGHRDLRMLRRYTHPRATDLAEELD